MKLAKHILLSIFICMSVYLCAAFISLKPNPADWDQGGRACFVVLCLAYCLLGNMAMKDAA
jgi:hypothetical protein